MRSPLALSTLATLVAYEAAALKVCAVLEPGFDMIISGTDANSITSDIDLRGYNVDVRKYIFGNLGVSYDLSVVESWSAAHVGARTGECDIGWAAFYLYGNRDRCIPNNETCRPESEIAAAADLTPFRCCTDFSIQYFPWSLSIMSPAAKTTFMQAMAKVYQKTFFYNFICFLFVVMVIFGHLVWFVERGSNSKHFPPAYVDGIDDGIWWAMVTATTVGYGDLVPITPAGRFVSMIYMLVGLSLFSILSGFIASEFVHARSVSQGIKTVEGLTGLRVCGYPSVLASPLFSGIAFFPVEGLGMGECGAMLQNGEVDAIVWDVPTMLYWRGHNEWAVQSNLKIGEPLNDQLVGLAVREGGFAVPELAAFHAALVDFRSSIVFDQLRDKWFPKVRGDASDAQASDEPPDWVIICIAITLVALYATLQIVLFMHERAPQRAAANQNRRKMENRSTTRAVPPADPPPDAPPAGDAPTAAVRGHLSPLEAKLVACLRQEMQHEARAALLEEKGVRRANITAI
jgi:ABC-type amino acid transport substrate-binding protein